MLDMFWSQDVILSSKWYWISFYTEDESKSANWLHLWCISTRVTSMMYKSSRLRIKLEVSQAQYEILLGSRTILWYKRRFEQALRPELRYKYYNSFTSTMHDEEDYITKQARCFEQRYQSWTCNHVPKLTLWTVKYQ